MSTETLAEFFKTYAIVNVAAFVLLAVAAYFSSVWVLDHLSDLDRWLNRSQLPPDASAADDHLDITPGTPPGPVAH